MRFEKMLVVVALAMAAACTKQNPAVCCVSDADCDALGIPRETGCAEGLACKNNVCTTPDCSVDADCAAGTPVCSVGVCVECDEAHACGADAPVCNFANNGVNTCGGCTDSNDCMAFLDTPVCDPASGACATCVTSADCPSDQPICDGLTCRACRTHTDCDSNACLPEGACGSDADTAYVDPTGVANRTCTKANPCNTIAAAVATNRPNIKLTGNITEAVNIGVSAAARLTIVSDPGTTLTRGSDGPILQAGGNTNQHSLRIYDLVITGNTGTSGTNNPGAIIGGGGAPGSVLLQRIVLVNNERGIQFGSSIELRDSIIMNNRSFGMSQVSIAVNNLIIGNGSASVIGGGVILTSPSQIFEFNTVVDNLSSDATQTGVFCGTNGNGPVTIRNNIISNNTIGSQCIAQHSLFDAGTPVSGTNRAGNPQFRSTNKLNPLAADFFRVGPQSPAIDGADPASTEAVDIDGEARPQGGARDIGADEFTP